MVKKLFVILVFSGFLINVTGCANREIKPPEGEKEAKTTISPTQSYEDCAEMTEQNVLVYSFKSSGPVNFNVHYHESGNVTYAVQSNSTSSEEGKFLPDRKQYYCLMWTNTQSEPVQVSYSYKVEKK